MEGSRGVAAGEEAAAAWKTFGAAGRRIRSVVYGFREATITERKGRENKKRFGLDGTAADAVRESLSRARTAHAPHPLHNAITYTLDY